MTDAERKAVDLLKQAEEEVQDQQFVRSRGHVRDLAGKDAYLVTCAQNNTAVHAEVRDTLMRIADHYDAELLVTPIRYKNPTGYDPDMQGRNDQWSEELHPFMVENEVRLHPKLVLMGQWRLQATTQRPLTGLDPVSGRASAIYGHGRLQMKTVATPSSDLPKLLYTTGSITVPNYSNTGLGQKGKFHHTNGALLVQKSAGKFHMRHLNWSFRDQSICDLNLRFTPKGVQEVEALALVTGDEHAVWSDPDVKRATYGDGGLVDLTRPRYLVRHDVLDSYAISHHHARDPVVKHVKSREGYSEVEVELRQSVQHLEDTTPPWAQNVMVASNHHEHLLRWLKEADPKTDPKNAPLYHKLMGLVLEASEMRPGGVWTPDTYALWVRHFGDLRADTRFLERNESFTVRDVELGLHGDIGSDGRRGSPLDFARLGIKTVTAHKHSPHILDGNYCVGHSRVAEAEYVKGPSSWLPTHCLIHQNGKRQLVHIIQGEF